MYFGIRLNANYPKQKQEKTNRAAIRNAGKPPDCLSERKIGFYIIVVVSYFPAISLYEITSRLLTTSLRSALFLSDVLPSGL